MAQPPSSWSNQSVELQQQLEVEEQPQVEALVPKATTSQQDEDDDDEDDDEEEPGMEDPIVQQLLEDVETLAAHLERQSRKHELESSQFRRSNQDLQLQLASMRIENEALRHQHCSMEKERDEFHQQAQDATESHEELLLALQQQQTLAQERELRTARVERERDALRRQLDLSKRDNTRMVDELAALQTQLQSYMDNQQALETVVNAAKASTTDHYMRAVQNQEALIESLRADVQAMEFENKTLQVGSEMLRKKISRLERRHQHESVHYSDVSLDNNAGLDHPQSDRKAVRRAPIVRPVRTASEDDDPVFTNLMELPNSISATESPCSSATSIFSSSFSVTSPSEAQKKLTKSFMEFSRKRLFLSPTNRKAGSTVVLPQ